MIDIWQGIYTGEMNRGGGRSFLAGSLTAKLARLSSRVAPPVWVITRTSQGHIYTEQNIKMGAKKAVNINIELAKCSDVNIF